MMLQFEKVLPVQFIDFQPSIIESISSSYQFIWYKDAYNHETTLLTFVAPDICIPIDEFPNPHYCVRFHSSFLKAQDCLLPRKNTFRISAPSYAQTILTLLSSLVIPPTNQVQRVRISSVITSLLTGLLDELPVEQKSKTAKPIKTHSDGLKGARALLYATRYMKKNMSNPQLSLQDIANAIGYNPNYFCQEFSKVFSVSPIRFLNRLRVNYALQLLEETELNTSTICSLVGFTNPNRLSILVKCASGMTPVKFRRSKKMQSIQ